MHKAKGYDSDNCFKEEEKSEHVVQSSHNLSIQRIWVQKRMVEGDDQRAHKNQDQNDILKQLIALVDVFNRVLALQVLFTRPESWGVFFRRILALFSPYFTQTVFMLRGIILGVLVVIAPHKGPTPLLIFLKP